MSVELLDQANDQFGALSAPIEKNEDLLAPVLSFLTVRTPAAWLAEANSKQEILLIDHAHCEKKAAASALNLMFRYVDRPELLSKLSQLAREELLHFDQVLAHMKFYNVAYSHLSPSRYAAGLRKTVRTSEPGRLVDSLIVGAYIEARSCERFAALIEVIQEPRLAKYYKFLLASESRHFEDYLQLARGYSLEPIDDRLAHFAEVEAELITTPDREFRFHSGIPS